MSHGCPVRVREGAPVVSSSGKGDLGIQIIIIIFLSLNFALRLCVTAEYSTNLGFI